jgi:L-idonate 5-dehydrogenase
VHFEASGNERAVRSGLEVLRPRGVLLQLGLGGDIFIPQSVVVAKEIEMRGTSDSTKNSASQSTSLIAAALDLKPLLTDCYGLDEVQTAFNVAGDRTRSMKVQLRF